MERDRGATKTRLVSTTTHLLDGVGIRGECPFEGSVELLDVLHLFGEGRGGERGT